VVIHPNNLIHTGAQFQTGGTPFQAGCGISRQLLREVGPRNPARPHFLFTSVTDYFIV